MLNVSVGNYEISESCEGQVVEVKLVFSNNESIFLEVVEIFEGRLYRNGLCVNQTYEIYADMEEDPGYNLYVRANKPEINGFPFEFHYSNDGLMRAFQAESADEVLDLLNDSFTFSCWDEDVLIKEMAEVEPEESFEQGSEEDSFTLHGALELVQNAKQTYDVIQKQLREKVFTCFKTKGDLQYVETKIKTPNNVYVQRYEWVSM